MSRSASGSFLRDETLRSANSKQASERFRNLLFIPKGGGVFETSHRWNAFNWEMAAAPGRKSGVETHPIIDEIEDGVGIARELTNFWIT